MEILAATLGIQVTQRVAAEPSDASESTLIAPDIGMSGIDFVYRYAPRTGCEAASTAALAQCQAGKKATDSMHPLALNEPKWNRCANTQETS
ncbi:hypothetical protein AB4084_35055, partial [Lysobacter sp. 2RAB21]